MLEVNNLKMFYETLRGKVKAVEDVTFRLKKGDAFGLAGESGCGKTSVALTILRLLPTNAKVISGEIMFHGENLLGIDKETFRKKIRWKKISVIFQGAMNSLNPVRKIGDLMSEAILCHENISKNEALERTSKLLDLVGIGADRIGRYPHELSGGMKQRTVIAMALACNPDLIIADEPTTALDVITQAQVLNVMKELQQKLGLSMILISHDLSIIAETCNKCAIMYAGKIVEYGTISAIYKKALHPYTKGLLAAFPSIIGEKTKLQFIPGFPPDLINPPSGCRFHPRCAYAAEICKTKEPKMMQVDDEHFVSCHRIR
jgi:peptide/nickel transport system ATP-binding protein